MPHINATFRAPRKHNRRFPGKLGKRPDRAIQRKQSALERHTRAYSVAMSDPMHETSTRLERLKACVMNTRKNLGLDAIP